MTAVDAASVLSSRKNSKEECARLKIIFLWDSRKRSVCNRGFTNSLKIEVHLHALFVTFYDFSEVMRLFSSPSVSHLTDWLDLLYLLLILLFSQVILLSLLSGA